MIQKIVDDTIAKTKEDPKNEFKKKLYLYSAHENNIAQVMITLDIFDDKIPNYGSFITFEVHNINNVIGFKVDGVGFIFFQLVHFVMLFADLLPKLLQR